MKYKLWSLAFIVIFGCYLAWNQYEFTKRRISDKVYDLPIGAYTFSFPRNALNSASRGKENVRQGDVELEFLLPEIQPETAQNYGDFAPDRTLTIVMGAYHYKKVYQDSKFTQKSRQIDTSFQYVLPQKRKINSFSSSQLEQMRHIGGVKCFVDKQSGSSAGEICVDDFNDTNVFLTCTNEELPNPLCFFQATSFLGHMSLHYRYPKKYLNQASKIHHFVFDYLKSHFKGVTDHD